MQAKCQTLGVGSPLGKTPKIKPSEHNSTIETMTSMMALMVIVLDTWGRGIPIASEKYTHPTKRQCDQEKD